MKKLIKKLLAPIVQEVICENEKKITDKARQLILTEIARVLSEAQSRYS